MTVSSSTWRSNPAASSRCTGRSAGVPGAASRVPPDWRALDEPVQQLTLWRVDAVQQFGDAGRVQTVGLEGHLAGMPRQADGCLGCRSNGVVTPGERARLQVIESAGE